MEHFRKELFATAVHSFNIVNIVKFEEKHDLLQWSFSLTWKSLVCDKNGLSDDLNKIQNI